MSELPKESIDTVMTSPPYFGLRDYGEDVKEIWGGDSDCEHKFQIERTPRPNASGGKDNPFAEKLKIKGVENYSEFADYHDRATYSQFCLKCNAWQGQLGLEPTFQLYLDHMMIVCAEIKRALKKTGSFWLNMGDAYASQGGPQVTQTKRASFGIEGAQKDRKSKDYQVPNKCLLGIPWRLALRLIDEQGWVLRNAGIWNKPNSMPSSVKDRLSNSYEFLFHFVKNTEPQYYWNEKTGLMVDRKSKTLKENIDWKWRKCPKCEGTGKYENKVCPRCKGSGKIKHSFWHSLGYWYDLDVIREKQKESKLCSSKYGRLSENNKFSSREGNRSVAKGTKWSPKEREYNPAGKNPGDVWTIPTQPRPEAHFATFPNALCTKPILATCPAQVCKKCGKARVRIVKKPDMGQRPQRSQTAKTFEDKHLGFTERSAGQKYQEWRNKNPDITIGWTDCGCEAGFRPGIALDPFAGRGTVLIMAKKLGRHYVGYELKREYCKKLIEPALEEIDPLFRNLPKI